MKSLVGDYRDEHLFTLRQSLVAYRHYQQLIGEVDEKVKRLLSELPAQVDPAENPIPKARNPRKTRWRNEPIGLREDLYRAFGVDLTQVSDSISA
jgi:transposase